MSGIGIVLTAHVKDPVKWESGFRSHSDLLKRGPMTTLIHYTITKNSDVVMYSETDSVDEYMKFLQSPEIVQAMTEDGVDRETLKVYALDKEFRAS
jgi:hypothetical protein